MTARRIFFVVFLDIKIQVKGGGGQMRLKRISSVNAGCSAACLVANAMKKLFEVKICGTLVFAENLCHTLSL